jgi:hypothetical protein
LFSKDILCIKKKNDAKSHNMTKDVTREKKLTFFRDYSQILVGKKWSLSLSHFTHEEGLKRAGRVVPPEALPVSVP